MLFRRLEERPATPTKFVNVGRPRVLWISAEACVIIADAERKILRKAGSYTPNDSVTSQKTLILWPVVNKCEILCCNCGAPIV